MSREPSIFKECLYDVEWQLLRISLLAENTKSGGFSTINGIVDNKAKLWKYIHAATFRPESSYRLWRVLNLCNATIMGYGHKEYFATHRTMVEDFRDDVQKFYQDGLHAKTIGTQTWEWKEVVAELRLAANERDTKPKLRILYKNLQKRYNHALRKVGTADYRPELVRFMEYLGDSLGV